MHAFVWAPSFRVYFCCIRTFNAMAAIILFLGGKIFQCVRLWLCCSSEYLSVVGGKKFFVKHVADKFYPKFFIWARKEFLYPVTDFIRE